MKFKAFVTIFAALCSATPALSADDDMLVLEPSSAWNLHYGDDSCVLRRAFGTGDQLVQLELRQFAPLSDFQASVFGKPSNELYPVTKYRFEPSEEWREPETRIRARFGEEQFLGTIFSASLAERPPQDGNPLTLQQMRTFAAADQREAARVTRFSVRSGRRGGVQLRTGNMREPIDALNHCLDELTSRWGIDVEAHQTLSRAATPTNLPEVPRMMDYPPKMLARGIQGIVNVRLAIDEAGGITACHIQMPLSDPAFEASACADLQHALEFAPALDRDGKPLASYWVTQVNFVIN